MNIKRFSFLFSLFAGIGLFAFSHAALAADTINESYYSDANVAIASATVDGQVEHFTWVFDETVTTCNYEAGDWTVNTAGDFNATITGLACTGSNSILYILVDTDANETSSATNPVISYADNGTAGSLALTSGNAGAHSTVTVTDAAGPYIMTHSPADSATSVSRTTGFTVTFTENIGNTTFVEGGDEQFTISPDPGTFEAAIADNVVTIDAPNLKCNTSYTVTYDGGTLDPIDDAGGNGMANGGTQAFTFTTASTGCGSSSDDGGATTTVEPDVTFMDAFQDMEYMPGDNMKIQWSYEGTVTYVNLVYTTDDWASYQTIVTNKTNTGSYNWTIPSDIEGNVKIRITGTDLVESLATDVSSEIVISSDATDATDDSSDESEDAVTSLHGVEAGMIIKSPVSSALYYISADMERYVFMNEAVYFTWYSDFDDVTEVEVDNIADFPLAGVMPPNPGKVLVKIQSTPEVYALSAGDEPYEVYLHEIPDEDTAMALYGEDWADYVIDLPPTMFIHFMDGEDADNDFEPIYDVADMLKREEL